MPFTTSGQEMEWALLLQPLRVHRMTKLTASVDNCIT